MDHTLLIHSPTGEHLGCFHRSAMVSKYLFETLLFIRLSIGPEAELLGHKIILLSSFWGIAKLFIACGLKPKLFYEGRPSAGPQDSPCRDQVPIFCIDVSINYGFHISAKPSGGSLPDADLGILDQIKAPTAKSTSCAQGFPSGSFLPGPLTAWTPFPLACLAMWACLVSPPRPPEQYTSSCGSKWLTVDKAAKTSEFVIGYAWMSYRWAMLFGSLNNDMYNS